MKIEELFASEVFTDEVMKERLPSNIYTEFKKVIQDGSGLNRKLADPIAEEMKKWAIEKGATHFTHWFQPMTGITAEKHDSFIEPFSDSRIITKFSGKLLIKGESDASSFPSGGLRATFEARGYTVWDPTSPCFIQGKCLYIPTAFCSFTGEALDKKTPLLRSMEAISKQAVRVLHILGEKDVKSVKTTVGAEQEYFLVDKEVYNKRRDLIFTGRTLFGNKPVKGQEEDDHYFGAIKPRVQEFMDELNIELWKVGVLAKTEHNEVAPGQHELAPIFTTTNIATDHNQIMMSIMKKIADKHGMVCLLHEKPFRGVAGSGKHNNWSISTDTGINLLDPGDNPVQNTKFIIFLAAVIKAVDENQDLLRISVASAGNDHRLGANEAPPAIVSMFLGDELNAVIKSICGVSTDINKKTKAKLGVEVLPAYTKDTTDRNRTSPFAFTGNKFEFRMLGSQDSIACSNIMINTAVAEELSLIADFLEGKDDVEAASREIAKKIFEEHRRIIFDGNGYGESWVKEAQERGLLNYKTTPEALIHYIDEKNIRLFSKHNVLSKMELEARYEILMENYHKTIKLEAAATSKVAKDQILPACVKYSGELAKVILRKKEIGISSKYEIRRCELITELEDELNEAIENLDKVIEQLDLITDTTKMAFYCKDVILPAMEAVRTPADKLEEVVAKQYWPIPTYGDLLFSVK